MAEFKHRQEQGSPEIEYGEIAFPDDTQFGTGSYVTILKPGALSVGKAVSSLMFKVPAFQISVNLNPLLGEINVLLGLADGSDPTSKKVFIFPGGVDTNTAREFKVILKNGRSLI